jgi:hypothetical protein
MPRRFFSYETIHTALNHYKDVFSFYREKCIPSETNEDSIRIPLPRLSPLISESLTKIIIDNSEIDLLNFSEVSFSNSGGDLMGKDENGVSCKIEVKSTGSQAFQYFGNKDLQADRIVWIHFGNYFIDNENEVIIYVFTRFQQNLIEAMPKSKKINLKRLLRLAQNHKQNFKKYSITFTPESIKVITL